MLLCSPEAANTTTIAAQAERQRIILVADSRESPHNPSSDPVHQVYRDDGCKLVALGHIGVGFTGNLDYKRTDPSDVMADWTAASDAHAAYELNRNDLRGTAREWVHRATRHYMTFYQFAPQRVRQLASGNPERVLVDGLFAGWEGDVPLLVLEQIVFDERSAAKIRVREQIPSQGSIPYATNATTQELIEGRSSRAMLARAGWNTLAPKVSSQEADWRHLAYLVKETGAFDKSVGAPINVLQIPMGGRAAWLQNATCQAR